MQIPIGLKPHPELRRRLQESRQPQRRICRNAALTEDDFVEPVERDPKPVSGLDLAGLLQGEEGLFLCQNRGQDYIAVAKAGHSIAYGPTPVGRVIQEQPSSSIAPEPWFVTKISNSTEFAEFRGTTGAPSGR